MNEGTIVTKHYKVKAMAIRNSSLSAEVTTFLDDMRHPFRKEIEQLREYILSANSQLAENIKWNAPNYHIDNNDRITMRIMPPKKVQLIFHRGAKVQVQPKTKLINDDSGILTWKGNDRAIATFTNFADIQTSKTHLTKIVKDWIAATL
jgi:hypothetical protein